MSIVRKSRREIEIMRDANRIVATGLQLLREAARPGVTTAELDRLAERHAIKEGGIPAFKGYRGYTASLCASPNSVIVHGVPSDKAVLREGDIIGLDFGVIYKGFVGDAAMTVPIGSVTDEATRLMEVTREALRLAIAELVPGKRLGDIGWAVQGYVEPRGYSVVRDFVGHGVGRCMHEDPQVPNYGEPATGVRLKEGMVLAIEPMINCGTPEVKVLDDGWTAVTADGRLSAHFEHSVAITAHGPEILSLV